ncbi:hypothetical protein [Olivibacter domesticus]|uniref:Uncharacterized protein n=1 Tax=Olivibacter domesticus TaxID=407022 RepID=A0A1H7TM81_OLID1|nr:hypothetical protein [Olivibacter domesticus]SEL85554.1 hypothetical protein SAMN05661044_03582 [Olivibacter domesticus]
MDKFNLSNDLRSFLFSAFRIILYALAAVLLAEFIRWDGSLSSIDNKFSEDSLTEMLQTAFLFISSFILLRMYSTSTTYKYTAILLFGLTGASLIREQDIYFEKYIGQGSWQIPAYAILIFTLYQVIRNRSIFLAEMKSYMSSLSFGIFSTGLITTYIFSRLFGRKVFWYVVMENHYIRAVKNAAEECLELYGYLLILISIIELLILSKQKTSYKTPFNTKRRTSERSIMLENQVN